jgi:DNA-binding Lrp family transcriptional regulator
MKGYYIEISNRLLDPKHYQHMGESVWLFMWLLDKMTSISEDGVGKVLGGKPIKFSEVKEELGISERTYRRWVGRLLNNKYIQAIRTPYGLSMSVNKAKKVFGRKNKSLRQKGENVSQFIERRKNG